MRKHPSRMMIATMVIVYGLLIITILLGRTPKLGLDLRGGVSVNLQPVKDGKVIRDVSNEDLNDSIEIIRQRVDALGVAEPEVTRQGNTITVQLPGAKDQAEVLEAVGKTAQLEFRPVLAITGQELRGEERKEAETKAAALRKELGLPDDVTAQKVLEAEQLKAMEQQSQQPPVAEGETTTTTVPEGPLNEWGISLDDEKFGELYQIESQLNTELTPIEDQKPDGEVTLSSEDGLVYRLGPVALTGTAVDGATASVGQQGWTVNPSFKGGENGIDLFNAIAAQCYSGSATCPPSSQGATQGNLGIVLDGEVLSAPTIQQPSFTKDQIQISGSFDQKSAESLAVSLRFGSLPVALAPQQSETVSATLGQGALEAGIYSGLIGLALVLGYMAIYYRLLGLITAVSLTISASLLWVILSNLSATVTLAGVVGLVASIGISLDSSIVFFENLKEEVRSGTTIRTSAERSFDSAFSTIIKADTSSLIGAVVLYWLSVGPVRGFAFMLGAATVLDLVAAYFFLRPAVVLLSRSKNAQHPGRFGIPVDDLSPEKRAAIIAPTAAAGAAAIKAESRAAASAAATKEDSP